MDLCEWSKSNADYGRRLLDSGVAGARSGQEAFLNGRGLVPFLAGSVRSALKPAVLGACLGVLAGYPVGRRKSIAATLVCGLAGGAIGLGLGLAWEAAAWPRAPLAASGGTLARCAMSNGCTKTRSTTHNNHSNNDEEEPSHTHAPRASVFCWRTTGARIEGQPLRSDG